MKNAIFMLLLVFPCISVNAQGNLDSLLDLSYARYTSYNFSEAAETASKAYDRALLQGDSLALLKAGFYREIANQSKSGSDFKVTPIIRYKDQFKALNLLKEEARSYLHLAHIYSYFGEPKKELAQYIKAESIFERLKDESGLSAVYSNMSLMCHEQRDPELAFQYVKKSVKIDLRSGNAINLHRDYNNLAIIFEDTGPIDSAIYYHKIALDYGRKSKNPYDLGISYSNLGNNYANSHRYELAEKHLFKALEIRDSIGYFRGIAYTNVRLGYLFLAQNQLKKSARYAHDAVINAEKTSELKIKRMCYGLLAEIAAKAKDPVAELAYFKKNVALTDSIRNSDNTKTLTKILMRHEFAQQEFADSIATVEKELLVQVANEKKVEKEKQTRNFFGFVGLVLLLLSGGLFSRWRYVRKSKAALQIEKDRSEKLLLNILPEEIAQELKEKGRADARDFETISILFTDFKDFTEQSAKLSAQDLVSEINTCFEAFDYVISKYNIEKIKTIGDAYMAAGGLPIPHDDSVKNTVLAALEMQQFIIKHKAAMHALGKPAFNMRVGIHTGPVVAGIVGVRKFQYDVWGDTVNTASRLESTGEAGKVNISQSTYEWLKDDPGFDFETRGRIKVKGKGEMEMYFVSLKKVKELETVNNLPTVPCPR